MVCGSAPHAHQRRVVVTLAVGLRRLGAVRGVAHHHRLVDRSAGIDERDLVLNVGEAARAGPVGDDREDAVALGADEVAVLLARQPEGVVERGHGDPRPHGGQILHRRFQGNEPELGHRRRVDDPYPQAACVGHVELLLVRRQRQGARIAARGQRASRGRLQAAGDDADGHLVDGVGGPVADVHLAAVGGEDQVAGVVAQLDAAGELPLVHVDDRGEARELTQHHRVVSLRAQRDGVRA